MIFQTRYEESVQQLRRMIQDGAFGHILSARSILTWSRPYSYYEGCDWKGTWDREGGGVLIDQAIHSIDRIRYMLGSEVEWIDGSIHNHYHDRIRVEDTAEAAIHLKTAVSTAFMPQIPMRPMPLFFWNSRAKKAAAV